MEYLTVNLGVGIDVYIPSTTSGLSLELNYENKVTPSKVNVTSTKGPLTIVVSTVELNVNFTRGAFYYLITIRI